MSIRDRDREKDRGKDRERDKGEERVRERDGRRGRDRDDERATEGDLGHVMSCEHGQLAKRRQTSGSCLGCGVPTTGTGKRWTCLECGAFFCTECKAAGTPSPVKREKRDKAPKSREAKNLMQAYDASTLEATKVPLPDDRTEAAASADNYAAVHAAYKAAASADRNTTAPVANNTATSVANNTATSVANNAAASAATATSVANDAAVSSAHNTTASAAHDNTAASAAHNNTAASAANNTASTKADNAATASWEEKRITLVPELWDGEVVHPSKTEGKTRGVILTTNPEVFLKYHTAAHGSWTVLSMKAFAGSSSATLFTKQGIKTLHLVELTGNGSSPPKYAAPKAVQATAATEAVLYMRVKADSMDEARKTALAHGRKVETGLKETAVFPSRDAPVPLSRRGPNTLSHKVGMRVRTTSLHALLRKSGDGYLIEVPRHTLPTEAVPVPASTIGEAFQMALKAGGPALGVMSVKGGWAIRCASGDTAVLQEALASCDIDVTMSQKYVLEGVPGHVCQEEADVIPKDMGWNARVVGRRYARVDGKKVMFLQVVASEPPPFPIFQYGTGS